MMAAPVIDGPSTARSILETELTTRSMGGGLRLLVASAVGEGEAADRDLRQVAGRIDAWAQRLTRFSAASDLAALNADPARSPVALRPTIAAVLSHAQEMAEASEGTVDTTLLDARMAAETDVPPARDDGASWRLAGDGHRRQLVREGRIRFDLDGVAKGWIADRALRLLDDYPSALVDADGDIAVRAGWPAGWSIAVGDPWQDDVELGRLRVPRGWPTDRFGVATSGTSVHRWHGPGGPTHHLIDPGTGRPALTDVVQATVVAESAGRAEALAKSAVIRGSRGGLGLLGRSEAWAALLLLESGDILATPGTSRWLD
jgi:thiamine biosynthesis lipoprotein